MSDAAFAATASSSARIVPWLLLLTALAIMAMRAPGLLVEPRFWAEEATVFYAAAQREPWLESLFYVPRHTAGYMLLAASVPATLAAKLLPIEWAPFATTYAAAAIVAVALAIVLFGRSRLWDSPARRSLACAVILLAPSSVGEVWLNSTNSQVYCGVVSLCILCEDLSRASRRRLAVYAALILLCGLSGVYTAFLFPAFAWKAYWERSPGASTILAVNTVGALVQVSVFAMLWSEDAIHPSKLQRLDWVNSAIFTFYHQFLVPLGARDMVQAFGGRAEVLVALARTPRAPALIAMAVLGLLCAGLVVLLLVDREARSLRNLLAISLASLALLTTVAAKYGRTTGRYSVVSGIALLLLLLAHARFSPGVPRWRPFLAAALLGWALVVGATGYRDDVEFRCPFGCPRWSEEVARWRSDPTYAPQVWPALYPPIGVQWRVSLPPPSDRAELEGADAG